MAAKRMEAVPNTEEKFHLADRVARQLKATLSNSLAEAAMLSYLNDTAALRDSFDQTQEANGLNVIYAALLHGLILSLTKMHDRASWDRASLPTLIALVNNPPVLERLQEEAAKWPGQSQSGPRAVYSNVLQATCEHDRLSQESVLLSLRSLRDINLAHALIIDQRAPGPTYGSLFTVLDATSAIVKKLLLAVLGLNFDPQEFRVEWAKQAELFWDRVRVGSSS